jgi:hypothetical protein
MNAHQEKIEELKVALGSVTTTKTDKWMNEVETWKPGKRREYAGLILRIQQELQASEAYERAMMLVR